MARIDLPFRVNAGGESGGGSDGPYAGDQAYTPERGWGYVDAAEEPSRTVRHPQYYGDRGGYEPHSSAREGMAAYRFRLPNGVYDLRLELYEIRESMEPGPNTPVSGPGERVFTVSVVSGGRVLWEETVDAWEAPGPPATTVRNVEVSGELLEVRFEARPGSTYPPIIRSIVIAEPGGPYGGWP